MNKTDNLYREIQLKLQAHINFMKGRQEKDGEYAHVFASQTQEFLEEIEKDIQELIKK